MRKNTEKLFAKKSDNIADIISIFDMNRLKHAFIIDEEKKLLGIVSDGDIRRAILRNISLTTPVEEIMVKNPLIAKKGISEIEILNLLIKKSIPIIPLLDTEKHVIGYYHIMDFIRPEFLKKEIKRIETSHKTKLILVIGGAGYIGSILARILLENGYSVRVLDNLMFGENSITGLNPHPNFEWIEGDFTNVEDLIPCLKNVEAVIHLAAIVGDPAGKMDPELTEETNYHGVKILAELCRYYGVRRFIFASTCSVYGASPNEILSEESALNPVSLYAESKLKAENSLLEFVSENFHPCIIRLATVFGLSFRMRFDLVINLLTALSVQNKEISIHSGNQWRPFIHVKDVGSAILNILNQPEEKISGEIFDIGSNENNFQIKDIGKIMKEIFPDIKINFVEDKEDNRSYRVSFKKAKDVLNFSVNFNLKDGIKEIADFLLNNDIDIKDSRFSNYRKFQYGEFVSIFE